MKKLGFVTISLCAAVCFTAAGGSLNVFADTNNKTVYPESTFIQHANDQLNAVTDYAAYGEIYAFADGNRITVIESENRTVYEIGSEVRALDCDGEVFYYKDGAGKAFSLPQKTPAEDYVFTYSDGYAKTDDGEYKLVEGKIGYCPKNSLQYEELTAEGQFSNLKVYDNVAYALNDNKLYKILKTELQHVNPAYTDFSAASKIYIGDTAEKLKTCNTEKPNFVTLKGGAYLTNVDLDDISGDYFKTGNTYKVGDGDGLAAGKEALLLCRTGENGEVSIVMLGGQCYILNSVNAVAAENSALITTDEATATVSIAKGYAYSSPYVCNGTKLFELKSGEAVKVIGKVLKTSAAELVRDFYKIEYINENDEKLTGYVPFGYISQFNYSEDQPSKTEDPDYNTSDAVKTVVLVLVIVALALIAVGYMTFVMTSGKVKKTKNSNKDVNKKTGE